MHVSSLKELVEDGWMYRCECRSVKVMRVLNQLDPKDPFVCPKISVLTKQDSGFDHCLLIITYYHLHSPNHGFDSDKSFAFPLLSLRTNMKLQHI